MKCKHDISHIWIKDKRYYQILETNNSTEKSRTFYYPRVTTILAATKPEKDKEALTKWKNKVGEKESEKISRKACDRGGNVHFAIEQYLLKKEIDSNSPFHPFFTSIKSFLDNSVSDIQAIETPLFHLKGFAGTVDCVAKVNGELSIIDWKTANYPKKQEWIKDYQLQLSAYCQAYNYLYFTNITQGVCGIALEGGYPAQIFVYEQAEMASFWEEFQERIKQFNQATKGKINGSRR